MRTSEKSEHSLFKVVKLFVKQQAAPDVEPEFFCISICFIFIASSSLPLYFSANFNNNYLLALLILLFCSILSRKSSVSLFTSA
jgi:hypothetical protein